MASDDTPSDEAAQILTAGGPCDSNRAAVIDAVLASMEQGFAAFHAAGRLIATNSRFRMMLDFPAALCVPGRHFLEMARYAAEQRKQFDAALSNVSQGVSFFDQSHCLLVANRRFAEIYGLSPDAIIPGMTLRDIAMLRIAAGSGPRTTCDDYMEWSETVLRQRQEIDDIVELENGRQIARHIRSLPDGGWVATHEDITEQRRAEASVLFMARHDALTKLPNPVLFQERLGQALGLVGPGAGFAVLCLDLDHFKIVNETFGHHVGDALLQAAADRPQTCMRAVDTVSRLGGDEFAIIQLSVNHAEAPGGLADRIIAAFATPFDIGEHKIAVTMSIGVATAPDDGTLTDRLLRNADIALYLAKMEGRGTVGFFDPEVDARIQRARTLELDLRGALARDRFELHFSDRIGRTRLILASGTLLLLSFLPCFLILTGSPGAPSMICVIIWLALLKSVWA